VELAGGDNLVEPPPSSRRLSSKCPAVIGRLLD